VFLFLCCRLPDTKGRTGDDGSGKSHFFAELLVERCCMDTTRAVCIREVQKSIKESVKKLLEDKIIKLGLGHLFDVLENEIRHKTNGSLIVFIGMQNHTAESIKSLEGYDIAWWEEAQTASKRSLNILRPTIRKPNSELWFSWNPDEEDAPIEELLRGANRVSNAIVVQANWKDNPFFPNSLKQELEDDKKDTQKFNHVWGGGFSTVVEGAVFEKELAQAQQENRITLVEVVSGVPVLTFWDLGQSDKTAIWFVQIVGMEFRLVDYYENSAEKFGHYVDVLAQKGYLYEEHCLPHDAEHDQLAAQENIKKQLQRALTNNPSLGKLVRIVPRIPKKTLGIDAARSIFPRCFFDREKTKQGLKCLKNYSYAKDEETGRVGKEPKHDVWSNGADAFLQMAQYYKPPKLKVEKTVEPGYYTQTSYHRN
jgi:phage terminase large subunit